MNRIQEIAITGRLASMSRSDAIQRIRAAGHVYVEAPQATTDLLVVGQDGPPIGEDGQLTRSLRDARRLQDRGAAIQVVPESAWIAAEGLPGPAAGTLRSTAQLAEMLDVSRATIRGWVRHGLMQPAHRVGRLHLFSFQQVAHARALRDLVAGGITAARIRASLEQLRGWLPEAECGPTRLDGDLLVRSDDGQLADASGQLRLDFDEAAAVRDAPRALPLRAQTPFEAGVQAEEEERLDDAARAYEREIALEGPRAEVCFNLGNVLYAQGRVTEAASRFREATMLESDYVEAWNNLGNVLRALDEPHEALRAYRHALAITPRYADAIFNLAQTQTELGEHADAQRHWRLYLEIDDTSPWADEARRALDR